MATNEELETEKLQAEIDSLKAAVPSQTEKDYRLALLQHQTEAERRKVHPTCWARFKEGLQLFANFIPLVAVIVAFLTLLDSQEKNSQLFERNQRATVSELSEGLSHLNAATRIAKANGLAPFLQDPAYTNAVVTVLIGAILEEPELRVRGALVQVIALGKSTALKKWEENRPNAWSSLEELRRRHVALDQELRRLRRQKNTANSAEFSTDIKTHEAELTALDNRVLSLQHAVVALAR